MQLLVLACLVGLFQIETVQAYTDKCVEHMIEWTASSPDILLTRSLIDQLRGLLPTPLQMLLHSPLCEADAESILGHGSIDGYFQG